MMVYQKNRILLVVFALFCVLAVKAQSPEIKELQAEMYKYFSTPEQEKFMEVTEALKEECKAANEDQLFYKAWGNQAIYLATHEQRIKAMETVKEMKLYASDHDNLFGEYTALHVEGTVYLRMHNYDSAEKSFKDAADFLHTNFPDESAAADYLELISVANRRNNREMGKNYGEKVLKEPNLQPEHKIRALGNLCQYAYTENDRDRFNELYAEWKELLQQTSGGTLETTVEAEYLVINQRYEEALELAERVPVRTRASLQAKIYHLMGDDSKAYQYLRRANEVKDSINREDQANVFSEYIIQSQTERLENERLRLEDENNELRTRIYIILIIAVVVISAILLLMRQRTMKSLRKDNKALTDARHEAETAQLEVQKTLDEKREFLYSISQELRTPLAPITGMSDLLADEQYDLQIEERIAMSQHIKENSMLLSKMIDDLMELSLYESMTSLPMDDPISPNLICRHMVDTLRLHCPEGVTMYFETTVPSNLLVTTNMECVEKVIEHLVNNAIEHTAFGSITIRCDQKDNHFCIAVEDTGTGKAQELVGNLSNADTSAGTSGYGMTTSMGLRICMAIMKLLGGRIYQDETYKKGTRYVFELPISSMAE